MTLKRKVFVKMSVLSVTIVVFVLLKTLMNVFLQGNDGVLNAVSFVSFLIYTAICVWFLKEQ